MKPGPARWFESRKFMWDGRVYASRDEAERTAAVYEGEKFEVRTVEEEGHLVLYTRRAVAAGPTTGSPTMH